MSATHERATIEPHGDGEFRVYLWGCYAPSSVLAGQEYRQYHGDFASEQAARESIRALRLRVKLEVLTAPSMKPYISLAHLPGEDDNVPGGALPDDIGEWPPKP